MENLNDTRISCIIRVEPAASADGPTQLLLRCDDREAEVALPGELINDIAFEREWLWYYEEHAEMPGENPYRARRFEEQLDRKAKQLFETIFPSGSWQLASMAAANFNACFTIESGAEGLGIPWELLRARTRGSIVRRFATGNELESPHLQTPLRILLLQPRNVDDRNDVAPLAFFPLYQLARRGTVELHVVRPGTLDALDTFLERFSPGHFQVCHYDGHGRLAAGNEGLSDEANAVPGGGPRSVITMNDGLGGLKWEPAVKLLAKLSAFRIPIFVSNACQAGNSADSQAANFLSLGGTAAVTFAQTVHWMACRIALEAFYTALSRGVDLENAVFAAAEELHDNPFRRQAHGAVFAFQDWPLLRLHSQKSGFRLDLIQDIEANPKRALGLDVDKPVLGRIWDLLELENKCRQNGLVVIRGIGGVGKTSLVTLATDVWQVTGDCGGQLRWDCHETIYSARELEFMLAQALQDAESFSNTYLPLPAERKRAFLISLIERRPIPFVLLLENFEAYSKKVEIGNKEARNALADLLADLAQSKRLRIIVCSRGDEMWLTGSRGGGRLFLQGLSAEDTSLLVQSCLVAQGQLELADHPILVKLLDRLGGHPLAIKSVLRCLKERALEEVSEAFLARNLDLSHEAEEGREGNLLACVEYSLQWLTPQVRKWISLAREFDGIVRVESLELFTKIAGILLKDADLNAICPVGLEALRETGLATDLETGRLVALHPALGIVAAALHPSEHPRAAVNLAFVYTYQNIGEEILPSLQGGAAIAKTNAIRRMRNELTNFIRAYDLALDLRVEFGWISASALRYLEIQRDHLNTDRIAEKSRAWFRKLEPEARAEIRGALHANIIEFQGRSYRDWKNFEEAHRCFHECLDIFSSLNCMPQDEIERLKLDIKHQIATTFLHAGKSSIAKELLSEVISARGAMGDENLLGETYLYLGQAEAADHQWEAAREAYDNARKCNAARGENFLNETSLEKQYGDLYKAAGDWAEADRHYLNAYRAYQKFDAPLGEAQAAFLRGEVLERQSKWKEAIPLFQKALMLAPGLPGGEDMVGRVYYELSMIAQQRSQWRQAKDYTERAVEVFRNSGDMKALALNLTEYGCILHALREFGKAENSLAEALKIHSALGRTLDEVVAHYYLGCSRMVEGRFREAIPCFLTCLEIERALSGNPDALVQVMRHLAECFLELDDLNQAKHWISGAEKRRREGFREEAGLYFLNGFLAEKEGETEEAMTCYEKSLEIDRKFAEPHHRVPALRKLARLWASRGKTEVARQLLGEAKSICESLEMNYELSTIQGELSRLAGC